MQKCSHIELPLIFDQKIRVLHRPKLQKRLVCINLGQPSARAYKGGYDPKERLEVSIKIE